MISNKDLQILQKALDKLKEGFTSFPDSLNEENSGKVEEILLKVGGINHLPEVVGAEPPHQRTQPSHGVR